MPQSGENRISGVHLYRFGPFAFYSEIELPELALTGAGAETPGTAVRVVLGRVPEALISPTFQGQFCSASPSEFLMDITDVAKYHVEDGSKITVEPCPGASALDIRGFLLGNVFAVLCHQRRLLPLHASAVRMGGGVVAFLGASGAGKSTLAAFLGQAGYPLVADDICLLDPQAAMESRVIPIAPWLKLWRGSLEALGQGTDGLMQTFSDEDKFRLPMRTTAAGSVQSKRPSISVEEDHLPLRAVVALGRRDDGAPLTLQLLKPVQAIGQMMKFTYQAFLLDWLGVQGEHFANCGKGLEGAQAYICERPWGFDALPEMLACLKENFG